jgi:hypothetical protein
MCEEEQVLDPVFRFPTEVNEMIFCHLNARKISKCTTVSRDWNNFIRSSMKFMDKFQITLNGNHPSFLKRANKVLQSNQNCSNIRIKNVTKFVPIVYDIMAAKSHWKYVDIDNVHFETTSEFIKFFNTFSSSVERFEMHKVVISTPDDATLELKVKKVKILSLSFVSAPIVHGLLRNCLNVESLTLGKHNADDYLDEARDYLKQFKNLKKLYLQRSTWFRIVFKTDDSNFKFKLDEFEGTLILDDPGIDTPITDEEKNMMKFFKTQTDSLKKVFYRGWFNLESIGAALDLPVAEVFDFTRVTSYYALETDLVRDLKTKDWNLFHSGFEMK